jgi:DNA-binding response OmpR family regulator
MFQILLVDKDRDVLELLENILKDKYIVYKTSDASKSLDILKTKEIELIISDVAMPGIDGFGFCTIIKSKTEYSHIPVILLTERNSLQAKIEGLKLGADACLEKPFFKNHLLAQVSNLIANRNLMRAHFTQVVSVKNNDSEGFSKWNKQFLNLLTDVIYENMDNVELDIDNIARFTNVSRPTLYRKVKSLTNLSPREFINVCRMRRAAELLLEGRYKVSEIAVMTGFRSASNFSRSFFRQFSVTPKDYVKQKGRCRNESATRNWQTSSVLAPEAREPGVVI